MKLFRKRLPAPHINMDYAIGFDPVRGPWVKLGPWFYRKRDWSRIMKARTVTLSASLTVDGGNANV